MSRQAVVLMALAVALAIGPWVAPWPEWLGSRAIGPAVATTSLAEVSDQLKAAILGPQRQALVQKDLSAVANRIGVHVNPRYGRWDSGSAKVVAPGDKGGLSSPAPSSST